jgi:hypothetical protein
MPAYRLVLPGDRGQPPHSTGLNFTLPYPHAESREADRAAGFDARLETTLYDPRHHAGI